jgi:hypothetical protein
MRVAKGTELRSTDIRWFLTNSLSSRVRALSLSHTRWALSFARAVGERGRGVEGLQNIRLYAR